MWDPPGYEVHNIEKIQGEIKSESGKSLHYFIEPTLSGPKNKADIEDRFQSTGLPRMLDVNDLEAIPFEEAPQRILREIMRMSWRMNHSPAWAAEPCIKTPDVPRRDRENPVGCYCAGNLGDVVMRHTKVLDSIPQTECVCGCRAIVREVIAG